MADQIPSLTELIKFGSLLDFEAAAVGFLLKSKNLQMFPEDEHFLKPSMLGLCPETKLIIVPSKFSPNYITI